MEIADEVTYISYVEVCVTGSHGFGKFKNPQGKKEHVEKYWGLPKTYPCWVVHSTYDPDSLEQVVGRPVSLDQFAFIY